MFNQADHHHMARAIQAAKSVRHLTRENPRVGAVVVQADSVVGTGATQPPGQSHAEVMALGQAGEQAQGATLYVTLEPCNHHGKTPPCVDAIIAAGIRRVVVASIDPNPQVNQQGVQRLQAAGIQVDCGLMTAPAESLNPGFIRRIQGGLPWVTVKLACSLDGATAMKSGESKWITGPEARKDVQRMRAQSGAIVSGIGTLLADDPSLNVRWTECDLDPAPLGTQDQPLRVVMDRQALTPPQGQWASAAGPKLVVHEPGPETKVNSLLTAGVETLELARVTPEALLTQLAQRGVNEVLVEAGPRLAGAWMQSGCVDRLVIFQAPLLMGSETRPLMHTPGLTALSKAWRLTLESHRQIGVDQRFEYTVESHGTE